MSAPVTSDLRPEETMVGTSNGVGLWIAPEGTPAPTPAGAPFALPWRPLGYASDDGPTLSGDTSSEAITPWQSRSPIRTIITERTQTVAFVLWQLNQDTLALYFGSEVTTDGDGTYDFDVRSDSASKIYAIGVDAKDGDNQFRVTYSRATLDSAGDLQLQKGAMVPLDVTLSALDDGGKLAHVYVKAGSGQGALNVEATPAVDVQATPAAAAPADAAPAADVPAADDAGVATGPAATDAATGDTGAADTAGTGA